MAALVVLLFHLFATTPFFRNGFYGVDLFFMLSGFILFHVHGSEFERPTSQAAKRFFLLRFLRVYPLHLVVLMAIVVQVLLFPAYADWIRSHYWANAFSLAGFLQTLTLTNCVGLPNFGEWNQPSWSLSSEALAYVLFPVLSAICWRQSRPTLLLVFVLGFLCLHVAATMTGHMGVARVLVTFPAGMAIARAVKLSPPSAMAANLISVVSAMAALLALAVDGLAPFCVFGFAGLIYSLARNEGPIASALSSKLAEFLGKISFSLYLTHASFLLFIEWATRDSVAWPVEGAAALTLGWLTFKAIEEPSHRFARKVARKSANRPHSAPVALG